MRYVAEPPPSGTDQVLAEYLLRQFYAIASATDTSFIVPNVTELPERPLPGGIVYLVDNGLYACISITEDGDAEWKQIVTA
jgi:hypothetical protein